MDKKRAEMKFIFTQALLDVKDTFTAIVFIGCAALLISCVVKAVNWLFAVCLFVLVPLVVGLAYAVIYKWCFDAGAFRLEEVKPDDDDKGGDA